MIRLFWILGSVLALLAVAVGAFGAHALQDRLTPERLGTFEIAARYQMYHALAILGVGWAQTQWPGGLTTLAGWFFAAGILLFSGSLYLLSVTDVRWLGAVAPLGGTAFMVGWACLALSAWRG